MECVFDSLLDIKINRKGFKKIKSAQASVDDEERYKLCQNSSIQSGMKRTDFKHDVLPYIYKMIHPNIRDTSTQLFSKHERQVFQTALEIMVMFDIKLKDDPINREYSKNSNSDIIKTDSLIANFEPDIGSLVTFSDCSKEFMKNKTQILILQNYEIVKQKMLTMGSTAGTDLF
jgi:hypothetical protein